MAKKLHYSQEQCIRAAGKLMQNTGMLKPHARVGIAVSGGVDSFVLLKVMQIRQRITPFPFEIMAIHINAGFDPNCHAPLVTWLEQEKIPYHVEVTNHGLLAHSEENRTKSPCYYCAFQRRKRLFELCRDCLLYTSDAADDLLCVDLGGRRIIKKKKKNWKTKQ